MSVVIDSEDDLDRWQYECPNGHHDWWDAGSQIWCSKCKKHGLDDTHDHLVDKRTDEEIPVGELTIIGYRDN